MEDDRNRNNSRIYQAKKIGLMVAGLFLLYVIIGFWVVPRVLKHQLEEQLSGLLGRTVTIADIKLNPLVLSARISTLTINEVDGQPFAGFESLYANTQVSSLFRWALIVKEIRVQSPFGVLKLLPGNNLNIDDLLAKLTAPKTKPEGKKDAEIPRAVIQTFQVTDGKAIFENLSGKEPIREELTPISFTLENLSTLAGRQGEYRFSAGWPLGGQFEIDGKITVNPVRVQGNYSINDARLSHCWEHLKDFFSFQVVSGTTDISGEYTIEIVGGQFKATLENGAVKLDAFKLVEKGKQEVLIALPAFSIIGIGADLQDREVNVELIQTSDGRIHSWLSPEGTFELQGLFERDLEKLTKTRKTEAPNTEAVTAKPWRVAFKKIKVEGWRLAFEDQTLARPATLTVDNIDIVVENLANAKGETATLDLSMRFNQSGDINIKGTAGIVPLQADLYVVTSNIALKSFQPYVDDAVNAQVHSGTTSSTGRFRYSGSDSQPQIRYEGDLRVDNLVIKDRVHSEDFITLAQLKTQRIGLELRPNKLKVAQVLIDRPNARVTIDESGVVNVLNALTPVENATIDEKGKENLLERLVAYLLVQFEGPMPMRVDRVQLDALIGDFVDASISPTFKTRLEIIDATATGLTSDPSAMAEYTFKGRIDGKGRLEGSGQMNPMNALKYSKANVSLKDFALPTISLYSGKFIGYTIDQGTLNIEMKYQVANDTVDGNNVIVVDQLALGHPVDSPDALKLPIKLGVTLLKDSEGRIKLQVPVKGNVKDPQFDFAKTIQTALTGTIEDIGSAPFAAIGEIEGFTGEELSTVAFGFGLSDLQEREIRKLNALASLLKERKALTLGIVGTADRRMDRFAIMGESPQTIASGDDSVNEDQASVEPFSDQAVDDRLKKLARQRSDAVSAYFIEQKSIDAARIHVQPVQINNKPVGEKGVVTFSLSAL